MSSLAHANKKDQPSPSQKKNIVLKDGWIMKESRRHPGKWYYFNVDTGKSTWELPPLPNKVQKKKRSLVETTHSTKVQKQVQSNQSKNKATPVSLTRSVTFTQPSTSKDVKNCILSSKSPATPTAAVVSKNTKLSAAKAKTYSAPKYASHCERNIESKDVSLCSKSPAMPTAAVVSKNAKLSVTKAKTYSAPKYAPYCERHIESKDVKDNKDGRQCTKQSHGVKRKVDDTSENKSTPEPVKKSLKTSPAVDEKNQFKKKHSADRASTSKCSLAEANKKLLQEKTRAHIRARKRQCKESSSSAECKPDQEKSSAEKVSQATVIPADVLQERKKSLTLFGDEGKATTEDTSVPMDVEMADVEVDEVRGQLHQIRDKMKNTPHLQIDPELHLPASTETLYTESHKDGLYIVLDTNVLISHLTFLVDLRDQSLKGFGKPVLIVPWVVLQELDGLKNGRSLKGTLSTVAKKAITAGKFIHTCIKNQHPRVRCQTPESVKASEGIPVECNDDKVLQCCLQYKRMGKGMLVVLFSNDVNLCTKTIVSGVSAFTKEDLLSGLKDLAKSKEHPSGTKTQEPLQGKDDTGKDKVQQASSILKDIQPKQDEKLASDPGVAATVTARNESGVTEPGVTVTMTAQEESDLVNIKNMVDDILCEVKKALTEGLSLALEREMKNAFDEQWLDIVFIKPPWTFKDLLRCYEKHWIAVFGMFMSKMEKGYLNQIQEHFAKSKGYGKMLEEVRQLVYSGHQLCLKLFENDRSNNVLQQTISTLSSLSDKCNKTKPKETKSAHQPSTSSTTSTTSKKNEPNTSCSSVPDRDNSLGGGKQTSITPLPMSRRNASSTPRQDAASLSTEAERAKQNEGMEKTARGSGVNTRSSIFDDEDVEMVLAEPSVPYTVGDGSTITVLQVFQSVGETAFSKSNSLITALHQSDQFTPLSDRHMVERSLVLLCSLLLTVVVAMARVLQCNNSDEFSHQGICDALDLFTRECEINPMGSGLQPATFQRFMSVQSNKQILANGLGQFAEKLQELHEYIKNLDSDLYTNCRQTLMALASQTLC